MSVEHHSPAPERSNERQSDLEQQATERLAEIRANAERASSTETAENRAEQAREVINRSDKEPKAETAAHTTENQPTTSKVPTLLVTPLENYRHTLHSLQRHLNPVGRRFSQVIHQPIVERTSEALEQTVARPSVLNGALWTGLIVGATFYLTARGFGYRLSGSEMLFALIVGAGLGIAGEVIWRAAKRG